MKIGKMEYAGVSNRMPSMQYVPQYTVLSVIPLKMSPCEVGGIDNRLCEAYPRAKTGRLRGLEYGNIEKGLQA